jgi:hypothetical protein
MLNNPMNLMDYPEITWQGQQRPTRDPDGRLCDFDLMSNGVRAGAKNLLSYFRKDGCKTISSIVSRYAPPTENPTQNYVAFVSNYCQTSPDNPVQLESQTFLSLLVDAIIRFEQGQPATDVVDSRDIQQGVMDALAD